MYIVKVYYNAKLNNVKVYEKYEHIISDLINNESELYEDIPEMTGANMPKIYSGCVDHLGFKTDFEFRFSNGVTVYAGEIMTEEALAAIIAKSKGEIL